MTISVGPNLGLAVNGAAGDQHYSQLMAQWRGLDALVQPWVISMAVTAQPASPADGDTYVVPSGATGAAWAGNTNKIARYSSVLAGWEFYTPNNGWQVYNRADGGDYLYNGTAWVIQGSQKLNVPQDYISGLKMVWNNATSISVTSGAAFVSSLGRLVQPAATLTLSALSLTASTWYHVYLYDNAGTPAIECVTTAPDAPYFGTARAKTGDMSRRYIGSLRTDSSGNLLKIFHDSATGQVEYLVDINDSNLYVLNGGVATALTTVSLATAVPVTSRIARIFSENTCNNQTAIISNSEVSTSGGILFYLRNNPTSGASMEVNAFISTDSSQAIQYKFFGTPSSGGLSIYVVSYIYER